MKKHLPLIALLALAASSFAATVEKGQPFPPYTLTDAFGATNTLAKETRFVIVSSEKGVSSTVNEWLQKKEKDFLPAHRAEYVSDITPMPALITKMFALPKMKKYPYRILLADNVEFARTYPSQPGLIAVFILDDQQNVADIQYVKTGAEVEALLSGEPR